MTHLFFTNTYILNYLANANDIKMCFVIKFDFFVQKQNHNICIKMFGNKPFLKIVCINFCANNVTEIFFEKKSAWSLNPLCIVSYALEILRPVLLTLSTRFIVKYSKMLGSEFSHTFRCFCKMVFCSQENYPEFMLACGAQCLKHLIWGGKCLTSSGEIFKNQ